MSAAKGVVFDLDGTLLDTLTDIAFCGDRLRAEAGLPPHPRDAYRGFVGSGVTRLVTRAFPPRVRRGPALADLVRRFERLYEEHCLDRTRPYPGVARLLDGLTRRGVPMAVVSNKPQRFTEQCVTSLLARWRFASVRGARPGEPLKPDPSGTLAAARSLGAEPAEIVYVGDTGVDMRTARAAGMLPVGALWGFRDAAELERCGARVLIRRPRELLALVDGGYGARGREKWTASKTGSSSGGWTSSRKVPNRRSTRSPDVPRRDG